MSTQSGDESKYTLEYHTAEDRDPQGPPFKYRTHYLDDAVAEAARHDQAGGRVLRVTRGGQVVFGEEELRRVLARVSEFATRQPGLDLREGAALALRERGEAAGA